MLSTILSKVFGTKNDRIIREYSKVVRIINSLEPQMLELSDEELRAKTAFFKSKLAQGSNLGEILPEAFAVVREASKRVLGLRHYDVQLMGGIALHKGCIAEMKTGEGKTLMATLALYLNSLTGSAHLVTVNDYLAKRDAEWMGPLYNFLGLSVGFLQNGFSDRQRREVYACDIVYGTNSEFGFDYLRDNMKFDLSSFVQRGLDFAIVDEVDSILIDEARTPLIISGASEKDVRLYKTANDIIKKLSKSAGDIEVDEKAHSVILTTQGIDKIEKALKIENIYAPENIVLLHHINQSLKAHNLFTRDIDYVLSPKGEVLIVDEFTGRALPGRRFSDGLHQAIEAKEGVKVQNENQTLATITLQNFFRMYKKLAGMTGTALNDAVEFHKIYNLAVVVVPTHNPVIREDQDDVIYLTKRAKFAAVIDDIKDCHSRGQPVLVGTSSIEASEHVSLLLKREGVPHNVLNAKQHEKEAEIVKSAGQKGCVTISTSMAGRGTDIKLGDGVVELGGLRVIGTERYENRRIDDQLRGRSGRQGDPGSSRFYISLEDDVMRIFGGDNVKVWMERSGMKEEESIESPMISSLVKSTQEKQEQQHFDARKNSLEFDDVMNNQRNAVYSYRKEIIRASSTETFIKKFIIDILEAEINAQSEINKDLSNFSKFFKELTGASDQQMDSLKGLSKNDFKDKAVDLALELYSEKRSSLDEKMVSEAEKVIILNTVDYAWKSHLQNLDHLKEGINLRGYGQKQPLFEYKKESFELFDQMILSIKAEVVMHSFKISEAVQGFSEEAALELLQKQADENDSDETLNK